MPRAPIVELCDVRVVRGTTTLLDSIDWCVHPGERWAVLGPNGAGKTTLVRVITATEHPTSGSAVVLGARLGHVDVRELRKRIGVASGAVARSIDARLTAREIVSTGRSATLAPWWAPDDRGRTDVDALLDAAGLRDAADRPFAALSDGERQRALLARMRAADAELLVLDEPAAGLDLGARERLIGDLAALAASPVEPPVVFVTHHVEEIPRNFTHLLLLKRGRVVAAGPVETTLTAGNLGATFDLALEVSTEHGRWTARAVV